MERQWGGKLHYVSRSKAGGQRTAVPSACLPALPAPRQSPPPRLARSCNTKEGLPRQQLALLARGSNNPRFLPRPACRCEDGWSTAVDGSSCTRNIAHCTSWTGYSDALACEGCQEGFVLEGSGANATCAPCAAEHCLDCAHAPFTYSPQRCFGCGRGYRPDDALEQCVPLGAVGGSGRRLAEAHVAQLGRKSGEQGGAAVPMGVPVEAW